MDIDVFRNLGVCIVCNCPLKCTKKRKKDGRMDSYRYCRILVVE